MYMPVSVQSAMNLQTRKLSPMQRYYALAKFLLPKSIFSSDSLLFLATAAVVVARTIVTDRIGKLNGETVSSLIQVGEPPPCRRLTFCSLSLFKYLKRKEKKKSALPLCRMIDGTFTS